MLVLVTAAFLNAAAKSLASEYPIEELGIQPGQSLLRTRVNEQGVTVGCIGGIASTSVIVITAFAPLVGFLIYKKNVATWFAYLLTGAIAVASIVIGFRYPVSVGEKTWMILLTVYVWLASSLPVWIILQPRDFTNVQILYAGIVLLLVAIVAAGVGGAAFDRPAFSAEQLAEGRATAGSPWPMLFVLVACGAISGFHSLVSTGTTAKQCWLIKHSRPIAFGGMLLESLLAACVLATIVWGLSFADYRDIVWPKGGGGNPVLAFAVGTGKLCRKGLGIPVGIGSVFGILMVEGFVVTTLDSSVRLTRYLFEELWTTLLGRRTPAVMKNSLFNSALAAVLMFLMCWFNAFQKIWPIFGAGNQLLAAMALLVVSMWLLARRRQAWFTLLPAAFMTVTTLGALVYLFYTDYLPKQNSILMVIDVVLILLAGAMIVLAIVSLARRRYQAEPAAP
jgi:carbon starvation protein